MIEMAARPAKPKEQPLTTATLASPSLRRTMIAFINRRSGYSSAGTSPDDESDLAGIRQLKPNLILMGIDLPGMSVVKYLGSAPNPDRI